MARILIVENDRLVAMRMARTLREIGHIPILAPDALAAFQELADRPDLFLLDLDLPDLPWEEFLRRLRSRQETAQIPVVVIAGRRQAATRLRDSEIGGVDAILVKPASGFRLRQAVAHALAGPYQALDPDALRRVRERQRALILRLIVEGSDALAFHISRRLEADRMGPKGTGTARALTWAEITTWGTREGLLDAAEARLLRNVPLAEPQNSRAGYA
jgi:two-component system chemotaxis response regulator CheY